MAATHRRYRADAVGQPVAPDGRAVDDGPITIDDPQLSRELRSWARSITGRNPGRTETVTSQLARLCVLRGRKLVRADLDATVKRETNPRTRED